MRRPPKGLHRRQYSRVSSSSSRLSTLSNAAIGFVVCFAEKAEEVVLTRKFTQSGDLETRQRKVIGIQIDRDDLRRIGDQIIQEIASSGRDRNDAVVRFQIEGVEIDGGVFPYLVINEALEHKGENAFQGTTWGPPALYERLGPKGYSSCETASSSPKPCARYATRDRRFYPVPFALL